MTKVYLIGPMTGIKGFNYEAFLSVKDYLIQEGFDVHSPTDLDTAYELELAMASPDGDGAKFLEQTGVTYEQLVSRSVAHIMTWKPDLLVALADWGESTGAVNEYKVGKAFGIETVEFADYDPFLGFPVEGNGVKVYDASAPHPADEVIYDKDGKFVSYADNPLRQRTITGGVKDNRGKAPLDLIPYEALKGAADVLAYGAIKYKPNNWRLGLKWMETWSSLQRHLWSWKEGEDLDPETGKPHIDHAMCQMLFLATYVHDPEAKQFDDRWVSSDHEEAKA